jgi:murein DD-endopeptidase MepM/ murein hydrolase activator NlpD
VASNRYAPEGTYDPYQGDDEPVRYGVYGSYSSHQDYGQYQEQGQAQFQDYGQYQGQYQEQGHFPDYGQYTDQYQEPGQFQDYGSVTDHSDSQFGTYGRYESHGSLWTETGEFPVVEDGATAPESAAAPVAVSAAARDSSSEEWNPTEESVRAVRGRHKVVKQRGGSMARSSAVLGVGMIAAVGAGGMATAQEKPAAISMPDVSEQAKDLPGVGSLLSGGEDKVVSGGPLTQGALTESDAAAGQTNAGEALRSRILQQAKDAQAQADVSAVEKATDAAEAKAQKQVADVRKAAAEKKAKAEAARLAKLAKSFSLPVSGAQLTSSFGESGSLWSNNHTGQDFAAASGTPIKAVGSGTVKEAGWAGSFGYRTIVELKDGTELWFAHQSSMNVSAGEKVSTGQVIGRVGSTGNVTGAHLHLEVHPGGGGAIDPMAWLRGKGLNI